MIDPQDTDSALEEVEFLIGALPYAERRTVFRITAKSLVGASDIPRNAGQPIALDDLVALLIEDVRGLVLPVGPNERE